MALYFRRSMKIAPGVRLNFSKRGVGVSVGVRGAHVSRSATGKTTVSAGIPGTGISARETVHIGPELADTNRTSQTQADEQVQTAPIALRFLLWLNIVVLGVPTSIAMFTPNTDMPASFYLGWSAITLLWGYAVYGGINRRT